MRFLGFLFSSCGKCNSPFHGDTWQTGGSSALGIPWAALEQWKGTAFLSSWFAASQSEEPRNQQTSISSAQIEVPWLTKQIFPMGTSQDADTEEKLLQKKPFSQVYPPCHTRTHQASVDLSCDFFAGNGGLACDLNTQKPRQEASKLGYRLQPVSEQKKTKMEFYPCMPIEWRYSVYSGSEPNSLSFQL